MKEELKPCPFCGREAFLWGNKGSYKIICKGCSCSVPFRTYSFITDRDEVINKWNERA